jgi:mannose-1-phosphate guanylyltransferase
MRDAILHADSMLPLEQPSRRNSPKSRSVVAEPGAPARAGGTWAIVLAGGEGVRLRPLVRHVLGDERPKQYARLLGPRTLLRQTLDRVALAIPTERTIVVTMRQHAGYMAEEFVGLSLPHVLVQPDDRGTAAGVLYPAHWIAWRDPDATIAVFPSDHFILGEATFMAHVTEVGRWIDGHPDRVVLLGAPATSPEVEYGWIEPGDTLGEVTTGPVRAIRRFWEKPPEVRAHACLSAGHLWNTSVLVGKVAAVLRLGWLGLPDLSDRMARIERFVGTPDEESGLRQAYALMNKANFSRSILEGCPDGLAVSMLPRLVWADLGNPRRVMDVVARMRVRPEWAEALLRPFA